MHIFHRETLYIYLILLHSKAHLTYLKNFPLQHPRAGYTFCSAPKNARNYKLTSQRELSVLNSSSIEHRCLIFHHNYGFLTNKKLFGLAWHLFYHHHHPSAKHPPNSLWMPSPPPKNEMKIILNLYLLNYLGKNTSIKSYLRNKQLFSFWFVASNMLARARKPFAPLMTFLDTLEQFVPLMSILYTLEQFTRNTRIQF